MLRLLKLILSASICSTALSSNIDINQTKVTWTEAVERCKITGSRIASKDDIDLDNQLCKKEILQNTSFWIGTNYILSNTIEVEGCLISSYLDAAPISRNGYHSLINCYQLCSTESKSLIFAHQNFTGRANCICNLTGVDIQTLGVSKQSSQCFNSNLNRWWKYKIHKNEFQTGNETCQQISCTQGNSSDKLFRDKLCGPRDNSELPDRDLFHFCKTNSNNNKTTDIGLPWRFSFMYSALIDTDSDQIESKVAKCKAIACVNGNRNETLTINCISETLGFICLNKIGTVLHVNNTQLTTSVSPVKVPMYSTEQPANNNSHTNARKVSTEALTSKEKKTSISSGSKLEHDASTSEYTKYQEQIANLATIPGAPDIKFHMPYISSDLHSHVTKSSKENIVHSTSHEVLNENVNDNSQIGLLVGIIVTTLVLVAVIVLLVVCRFKRKGLFRNKLYGDDSRITMFNSPNYKETDITSDSKTQTVQNSTYDMHDMHTVNENENGFSLSVPDSNNINNKSNSEYAVVIKNKQIIGNDTNQQQSHDEESLDVTENEYDGLNHNRPDSFNKRNNTNNIYDTALGFRDKSDPTYVTASQVQIVEKDENCVYDHI